MTAKVCIHMEGKKTTISSPGVRNFVIFFGSLYVDNRLSFYMFFNFYYIKSRLLNIFLYLSQG